MEEIREDAWGTAVEDDGPMVLDPEDALLDAETPPSEQQSIADTAPPEGMEFVTSSTENPRPVESNLLGEEVTRDEALGKNQRTGTAYKVFERVDGVDLGDGEIANVWLERGETRHSGQRAAIIEVVGEQAGVFMAIPSSSAQEHPRSEVTRLVWDDA